MITRADVQLSNAYVKVTRLSENVENVLLVEINNRPAIRLTAPEAHALHSALWHVLGVEPEGKS